MGYVMNTDYTNPEYQYAYSIWRTIRDCIAGEKAIKESDYDWAYRYSSTQNNLTGQWDNYNDRPIYLPMPNPSDQSSENKVRYLQYVQRASFYGATARTLNGMMGMVFKTMPDLELSDDMNFLSSNVDGSGVGLIGQSQEVTRDVISVGRCGLYVDYPMSDNNVTREDVENSGIRATINMYKAESIIDWDCMKIGAANVLSYIKLKEVMYERGDDYSMVENDIYRCLFLENVDGQYIYTVRVYDDNGEMYEEFMPMDGQGNYLNHIPFYFVGSVNNRPNVDDAPLQEIADLNIKHYRNSADFEESSFIVGQPTLVAAGMNENWMKEFYPNGIPFGSRAGLGLPVGASASLIQAGANSMPAEGMKHKEQQMVSLGARLITDGGQAETAEAARIKHEADVSSLAIAVANINAAYNEALDDVALFTFNNESQYMRAVEDSSFEISTSFFETTLTAQDALALVQVWQSGAIDKMTLDKNLKKGRLIDEMTNLEDMNDNISNEMTGVRLDG